jgi:hypothetical protein
MLQGPEVKAHIIYSSLTPPFNKGEVLSWRGKEGDGWEEVRNENELDMKWQN